MAKTTRPDTVVLIDDEIHNMSWMIDHLESGGYTVITASNTNDALRVLDTEIYRAVIVDLNIPVLEPLVSSVVTKGDVYGRYPGLYVAFYARNRGYRDRQVVIYSVHRDPAVSEEASKLGCTYIIKGRPKEIKRELDEVMSFDPTDIK
jgi:CheY-like chemotaxis protein